MYDSGAVFSPSVLDITDDCLLKHFTEVSRSVCLCVHLNYCSSLVKGVANVAAVSLQIGYPTIASVPHSIVNGFKVREEVGVLEEEEEMCVRGRIRTAIINSL